MQTATAGPASPVLNAAAPNFVPRKFNSQGLANNDVLDAATSEQASTASASSGSRRHIWFGSSTGHAAP
eukprot:3502696-Karenia_brevis.AAC.1